MSDAVFVGNVKEGKFKDWDETHNKLADELIALQTELDSKYKELRNQFETKILDAKKKVEASWEIIEADVQARNLIEGFKVGQHLHLGINRRTGDIIAEPCNHGLGYGDALAAKLKDLFGADKVSVEVETGETSH